MQGEGLGADGMAPAHFMQDRRAARVSGLGCMLGRVLSACFSVVLA